jgi:chemotaxis protein MotB
VKRQSAPAPTRSLRASSDRWLFGYADIVTLLFACFASLYAAQAMRAASAPPVPTASPADIRLPDPPPPSAPPPPAPVESPVEHELRALVAEEPASAGLDLTTNSRGLVLSLAETGSFAPGRAELQPSARRVLLTLASALGRVTNLIRVEGHTDDVPIHTPLFASNWELSTARATRVVQFLIEQGGLNPTRLSAAGYGEYHPRVPNTSPELRARNRRVDVVVLDVAASRIEAPDPAPAAHLP